MTRFIHMLVFLIASIASIPSHAGSLAGLVSDAQGNPIAGVSVEAVYQTYRADDLISYGKSVKASTTSDAQGRYYLDLGHLPPGEYAAFAYRSLVNGDREMLLNLVADQAGNFASNADTWRSFTETWIESSPDLPYGNGGIFLLQNAILDYTDLSSAQVTFRNVDTDTVFTRSLRLTGEGLVATGIGFGTYRVEISLDGRPLQLRLFGSTLDASFLPSVQHAFTMGSLGNQFIVEARP